MCDYDWVEQEKEQNRCQTLFRRVAEMVIVFFAVIVLSVLLGNPSKATEQHGLVIDVPQPGSVQSGIGLIHGWICGGGPVSVTIDEQPFATVTADAPRWDVGTAFPECGPSAGFGLPINWGNLTAGPHRINVNGVEVPFQVGGFSGFVEQVDFSKAAIAPGFDDTFWLYGVTVDGQQNNLLYRWEPSVQGLSILSVEPAVDVQDPCGFSPPDPNCGE